MNAPAKTVKKHRRRRPCVGFLTLPAVVILAALTSGCSKSPLPDAKVIVSFKPADSTRLAKSSAAIRRAFEWAKTIEVTPWRVRSELGMKGMKHFVEKVQLLRYVAEWPGASSPADKALADEARKLAVKALAAVRDPRFHTLEKADNKRFSQDNMSYLRAIWLARRFGYDMAPLRAKLAPLVPRFAADAQRRGYDQRMSIAFLLNDLGLQHSETPEDVYPQSRIGSKISTQHWQKTAMATYDLTHEIFAMTHRGARPFPFRDDSERRYAVSVARTLLDAHVRTNNPDMAAELVLNLGQLGVPYGPQQAAARKFLLGSQNKDGSFGAYDQKLLRSRMKNPAYDAKIGGYLHTTMVSIWALMGTS